MTQTVDSLCDTGDSTIDAHHRQLAGMIDKAVERLTQGAISSEDVTELIVNIERYAEMHFAYEETVIIRACPASVSSKNQEGHAYFKARLANLIAMRGREPVISTYSSSLTLLREWLTGHVCDVDCRLRDFIRKND